MAGTSWHVEDAGTTAGAQPQASACDNGKAQLAVDSLFYELIGFRVSTLEDDVLDGQEACQFDVDRKQLCEAHIADLAARERLAVPVVVSFGRDPDRSLLELLQANEVGSVGFAAMHEMLLGDAVAQVLDRAE